MTGPQYWITNLLLADRIARANNLSRFAAVQRCARNMRDNSDDEKMMQLAGDILKAPPHRVVAMIDGLYSEMEKEGLL